jgi:hypothetical protein
MESDRHISYIDPIWLLHAREFIGQIDDKLRIRNIWELQMERIGGQALMDAFSRLKHEPAQMAKMNYWHLFFQVNTVSDLCNAEGTHI